MPVTLTQSLHFFNVFVGLRVNILLKNIQLLSQRLTVVINALKTEMRTWKKKRVVCWKRCFVAPEFRMFYKLPLYVYSSIQAPNAWNHGRNTWSLERRHLRDVLWGSELTGMADIKLLQSTWSLKFEICIQLKNAILQKPTDFTVWSPLNDVILSDKVGEVVWFTWIMWWFLFPRSCLTSTKRNAVVEKTIGQQFAPRTAFFRVPCSITNWDAILCSALQGIIDGKNKRLLTFMQATATSLQAGIPWNDPTDGAHLLWGSETVSFRGRASLFLYPRSFEFSGIWLWHFTLTCYKEDL